MVFKKSKSLLSGLSPDISPQKLRELLDEMERLGRKGGNWSSDASEGMDALEGGQDRKSTRLNSSHLVISYAVFCLKKKKNEHGASRTKETERMEVDHSV